jgi:hypothetical protein
MSRGLIEQIKRAPAVYLRACATVGGLSVAHERRAVRTSNWRS